MTYKAAAEQLIEDIDKTKTGEDRLRESLGAALWLIGVVYDTDEIMNSEPIQKLTKGVRKKVFDVFNAAHQAYVKGKKYIP